LIFFSISSFDFRLIENWTSWLSPSLGFHKLWILVTNPGLGGSPGLAWVFFPLFKLFFFKFRPSTFIKYKTELYFLFIFFLLNFSLILKITCVFSDLYICYSLLDILWLINIKLIENWASWFSSGLEFNGLQDWDLYPSLKNSSRFTWYIFYIKLHDSI